MTTDAAPPRIRVRFTVTGVVQGVGFRPHVARLAERHRLAGWCHNSTAAVTIEVEGPPAAVELFRADLVQDAPPLARVLTCAAEDRPVTGEPGFHIAASDDADGARTLVPPDVATCDDCLAELRDPADRRYGHPFLTCTNCGPRLTIITDVPYDRPATSMAAFPMCPACAAEYADPHDRRYHAQPIACPQCGPRLRLLRPDPAASTAAGPWSAAAVGARDAEGTARLLDAVRAELLAGRVVAVKGLGGFHLAVNARNEDAVSRLRERKHRPHQPFAVMAHDLATALRVAVVGAVAADLLTDPARPIVVLPARGGSGVAPSVAPGLDELGVMLPYTPVHHLLLDDDRLDVLVMTSANPSGEPLVTREDEALSRLAGIADLVLSHDREIVVACEDSVWMMDGDEPLPVRRSRGYAPLPVPLGSAAAPAEPVVLAAGAELKNTVALTRDGWAFVSPHIGDLESLPGRRHHEAAAAALVAFHQRVPEAIAADAHPGYASRAWAVAAAEAYGVPLVTVQHHHAHLAALAAEHGLLGGAPLLGIVADGTGYGCDETIWGGELLLLTERGAACERLGHLRPWPLPGGDAGVRHPSRQAVAALAEAGVDARGTAPYDALGPAADALAALVSGPRGWVATSSAGRLFDVAAALLGVRQEVTYEAQAAVELEALARQASTATPAVTLTVPTLPVPGLAAADDGMMHLDPRPLLAALAGAPTTGPDRPAWARGVHEWLAAGFAELAAGAAARHGLDTVGLTGGCFQNRLLLEATRRRLAGHGLRTLTHRIVPPNDGGLALGQCAVASARLTLGRRTPPASPPHPATPATEGR